MKLFVLNDNSPSGDFASEHGLSYFIEAAGQKILFDVGPSMVFLKNAQKMGIDVDAADLVVLSHGHWDHTNGLAQTYRGKKLEGKPLLCHPNTFVRGYRLRDKKHHGAPISREEAQAHFQLTESAKPYKIADGIWFLGEIPRKNGFEQTKILAKLEDGADDLLPDDTALAFVEAGKLHVITGCSHSGIANIVAYAMQVTGCSNIATVMGGFHLSANDARTQRTVDFFKANHVKRVIPSHCTKLPALAAFYDAFRFRQVTSGSVWEL